jgi:dUTP pyrophosphatase
MLLNYRGFERVSLEQWKKDAESITEYLNVLNAQLWSCWEPFTLEEIYNQIICPKRATARSAGYDFFCPFDIILKPGEDIKIPTGIKVYMGDDEYFMIVPRSSMGFKFYMRLANTVAVGDSDYYDNPGNEGHYFIKIRNESRTDNLVIEAGQAFAQGIFQTYLLADADNTNADHMRIGGFGSTDA